MAADTPHILVIEDDADTRANLADILDLDGYRVSLAATLAEARELGAWEEVSVVLLDRKLPDGTAEELLPFIRDQNPHLAIIIVTGYRDLEGVLACLREGTEDFILKPVNADELRLALRRILDSQRTQRALRESEARFRAVIETAVDAIIMIDDTGTITDFNPAAEKLFGYHAEKAIGRNVRMLMPEPYRQEQAATSAATSKPASGGSSASAARSSAGAGTARRSPSNWPSARSGWTTAGYSPASCAT